MRSANCFPAPLPKRSRQSHWKDEDDGGENTKIKEEDEEEEKLSDLTQFECYSQADLVVTDNDLRLAQTDNSFLATRINNAIGYALTDLSRRRAIEGLPVDQEAMSLYQTAFASKISQVTNWRQQLSLGPYSAMSKIGALASDDTFEIYPGQIKVHVIALPMSKEEIQVFSLSMNGLPLADDQKTPGSIEHTEIDVLEEFNSVWLVGRLDFLLDTRDMFADVQLSVGTADGIPAADNSLAWIRNDARLKIEDP